MAAFSDTHDCKQDTLTESSSTYCRVKNIERLKKTNTALTRSNVHTAYLPDVQHVRATSLTCETPCAAPGSASPAKNCKFIGSGATGFIATHVSRVIQNLEFELQDSMAKANATREAHHG